MLIIGVSPIEHSCLELKCAACPRFGHALYLGILEVGYVDANGVSLS